MVDPASIAIGAAIGVATRKFTDKALSLSAKWVAERFKGHLAKARKQAQLNTVDFVEKLAQRVKTLEEQNKQNKKIINKSLSQPDFSILLQKAAISSAQTEDEQKHELLARLVAGRLTKQSESQFSLTSQLACDAISKLNTTQMKILGLLATFYHIRLSSYSPKMDWTNWLTEKLSIYQDITPLQMDYLHLMSLSCIKWDEHVYDIEYAVAIPKRGIIYEHLAFTRSNVGEKIMKLWYSGLGGAKPTSIGILIGIYVSDMLLGLTTPLDDWEKS